jgi:hypothetical protein
MHRRCSDRALYARYCVLQFVLTARAMPKACVAAMRRCVSLSQVSGNSIEQCMPAFGCVLRVVLTIGSCQTRVVAVRRCAWLGKTSGDLIEQCMLVAVCFGWYYPVTS